MPSDIKLTSKKSYIKCIEEGAKDGAVYGDDADRFIGTKREALKLFHDFVVHYPSTSKPKNGVHFCEVQEVTLTEDGEIDDVIETIKTYGEPVNIVYNNEFRSLKIQANKQ